MRFVVVVAMYNMGPWIKENIQSLKHQTFGEFRCLIGDDVSTDDSLEQAQHWSTGDERFEVLSHSEKVFSMGNIHSLIEHARPADDDVIVLVDGDDRLAHDNVLQRLADTYREHKCWMTYGSYASTTEGRPDAVCRAYPGWAVRLNCFRAVKWRASHLKTFKYGLWKHIPPSAFTVTQAEIDQALRRALFKGQWRRYNHWRSIRREELVDPSGRFARRCSDKVLTSPMLELAGGRSRFIPEVLYIYRSGVARRHFTSTRTDPKWYQRLIRDIVRHKPRLNPIRVF